MPPRRSSGRGAPASTGDCEPSTAARAHVARADPRGWRACTGRERPPQPMHLVSPARSRSSSAMRSSHGGESLAGGPASQSRRGASPGGRSTTGRATMTLPGRRGPRSAGGAAGGQSVSIPPGRGRCRRIAICHRGGAVSSTTGLAITSRSTRRSGGSNDDSARPHHRAGEGQDRLGRVLRRDLRLDGQAGPDHFAQVQVNESLTFDFADEPEAWGGSGLRPRDRPEPSLRVPCQRHGVRRDLQPGEGQRDSLRERAPPPHATARSTPAGEAAASTSRTPTATCWRS